MADTTPTYGWPYQELGDPPDGADLGQDLALAIEATVDSIDDRLDTAEATLAALPAGPTSYTPALTASSVNPTLGSGGDFTQAGHWWRVGKMVYVTIRLRFGSSGNTAGTGDYKVSLPTAASATLAASGALAGGAVVGSGVVRDNSAVSSSWTVTAQLETATTVLLVASSNGAVGAAVPWAWAASDGISLGLSYPID